LQAREAETVRYPAIGWIRGQLSIAANLFNRLFYFIPFMDSCAL